MPLNATEKVPLFFILSLWHKKHKPLKCPFTSGCFFGGFFAEKGHWSHACKGPGSTHGEQTRVTMAMEVEKSSQDMFVRTSLSYTRHRNILSFSSLAVGVKCSRF